MAIYGFLLFKFSAHKGQGHKPVMLNSLDGQHFFHLIDTDLRKLKEDGTLAGKPQSQQPDLDSDATEGEQKADHSEAVLKVESISTMGHVVRFTVRYGREGAYDIALSAVGDPDIDLTSRAPSRLYRGAFIVPPNGTRGFVAIETISRVRPLTSLLKWLRFKSPVPWRIKVDPTIDSQEFERALEESSNVYLEFEKRQPSEDNAPAREKKLRVHAPITTTPRRDAVKTLVKGWYTKPQEQQVNIGHEMTELAAIVDTKLSQVDFDDGRVVIEDNDGVKRSYYPTLRHDLFMYYTGHERIHDDDFYDQVNLATSKLFTVEDIDMPPSWQTTR